MALDMRKKYVVCMKIMNERIKPNLMVDKIYIITTFKTYLTDILTQ